MLLDVLGGVYHTAESFGEILFEETRDEFSRVNRDLGREVKLAESDSSIDFIRVLVVEWRVAGEHLENQNSERPPVHAVIMSATHNDFWGKILGRAAERERSVADLFGEAEVRDFEMAIRSDKKVLRFHIAVGYPLSMQIFQRENNLRHVEQCNIVWE